MDNSFVRIASRAAVIAGFIVLCGGFTMDGCSNGTTSGDSTVDESCPGPGCDENQNPPSSQSTPSNACGQPGQCPCSLGDDGYCGYCKSAPADQVCRYCPSGSYCPSDPCSKTCAGNPMCPANHPVYCGNDLCCPSSHPVCCPDIKQCGTSEAACKNAVAQQNSDNNNSSSGGCSYACPSGWAKSAHYSGCCANTTCPADCSNACGQGWYEVNGQVYGPCSDGDTTCINNAANNALQACGI